jgi:hypothetical protein
MTLSVFLGSPLPYAIPVLIAAVVWLYFNKFQPWFNRVVKPLIIKWLNRKRYKDQKRWDIHAR